jgi:hypothetical protein
VLGQGYARDVVGVGAERAGGEWAGRGGGGGHRAVPVSSRGNLKLRGRRPGPPPSPPHSPFQPGGPLGMGACVFAGGAFSGWAGGHGAVTVHVMPCAPQATRTGPQGGTAQADCGAAKAHSGWHITTVTLVQQCNTMWHRAARLQHRGSRPERPQPRGFDRAALPRRRIPAAAAAPLQAQGGSAEHARPSPRTPAHARRPSESHSPVGVSADSE